MAVSERSDIKALILFGPPGSGKGTQARLLRECLDVPHVSTGEILRERIRKGVAAGEVAGAVEAGGLVPDEVVNRLVSERLSEPDARAGFILDGYPRTLAQAEYLTRRLDEQGVRELVIHLRVDYNVVIERSVGRRQCPRCGAVYNIRSQPPREPGVCDVDGTPLIIRVDDTEPVIRERLKAYEAQTLPLIGYLRGQGRRVLDIDADALVPAAVFEKICGAVRNG